MFPPPPPPLPPPPPPLPPPPPYNCPNPNPSASASASADPKAGAPCAACKYQRRSCPPCILAPYFPAHLPQRFVNAHRLFGRHNIARTLRAIPDPDDREDAAKAIIFEAEARSADRVGGAPRYLLELQRRVWSAYAELRFIQRLIQHVRSYNNAVVRPPPTGPRFGPRR